MILCNFSFNLKQVIPLFRSKLLYIFVTQDLNASMGIGIANLSTIDRQRQSGISVNDSGVCISIHIFKPLSQVIFIKQPNMKIQV